MDEVFARMTIGAISTPLVDALGSVLVETDATESVTTTYAYEPYGKSSRVGTNTEFSQGYTGREEDLLSLYYYRARYYSPVTARFLQPDPIGFAGGINVYAYVWGNPINFRDPFGLEGETLGEDGPSGPITVDPTTGMESYPPVEERSAPQQYFPDNTGAAKQAEKACNAANKAAVLEDRADNYRRRGSN